MKIGTEGIEKSAKKSISVNLIESSELIHGIDLIKIDAEGSEADIISSIKDFIFSNHPILFVEILENTPLLRKLIIELIRKCNYQVYVIGHQLHLVSEQEISNISFYQKYKTQDVILSPHSLPLSSV